MMKQMMQTFFLLFSDGYDKKRRSGFKSERYLSWDLRTILLGFIPFLFLLTSCSGGGGGGGGGSNPLSVELAFTPGNGQVTVNLVEKRPLVRLLNISTYHLMATDLTNRTTIEKDNIAEESLNGTIVDGLGNGHNYTFALLASYFPVGSDQLSNLSIGIDYADANAKNIRDDGGITIGHNWDGDYLANLVDEDDDNDGVNDAMDGCSRGELSWQRNRTTDFDGDGCRDQTEDPDDDNDGVNDGSDSCAHGELGWQSNDMTDNDGDGCRDEDEDSDDDNDRVADSNETAGCELKADCDNDDVGDADEIAGCEMKPDCDDDDVGDADEIAGCEMKPDCDDDDVRDADEIAGCVKLSDCDGDGETDALDIDDDGDGLIELSGAAALNTTRHVLDGSGLKISEDAETNRTGCGNGGTVTACNGYELTRDISLADYKGGKGWVPIGSCNGDMETGFSGVLDGNGFSIRDLKIARPMEDCIGLFGRIESSGVIRHLVVVAETIEGQNNVGVLAGLTNSTAADNTVINAVSVIVDSVGGSRSIGGLIGFGGGARVTSSSLVAGSIGATDSNAGGVAGEGHQIRIFSSFVLANKIESNDQSVGGLVGLDDKNGDSITVASYAVVGLISSVTGTTNFARPGGLIGKDDGGVVHTRIINSYAVSKLSGGDSQGGLIGDGAVLTVSRSYWDLEVSNVTSGSGLPQSTNTLRRTTDYTGVYADWDDRYDYNPGQGDGGDDITVWCDSNRDGEISTGEKTNPNRIWDFGGSDDYPAIRCTLSTPAEQRSWWSINSTTNQPQLNQIRLDSFTSP